MKTAQHALEEAVQAAGALAGEGWTARLTGGGPRGPGEIFLAEVYSHVRARSDDRDAFYTLEAEPQPLGEETAATRCADLSRALKRIAEPLARLAQLLRKKMDDKSATLEPYTRARLEAAARGLDRRAKLVLPAWTRCWTRWRPARSATNSSTGSRSPRGRPRLRCRL